MKEQGDAGQQQAGKGNEVQTGQGGGQPLVIAGQPGEGPLDDPPTGQEHKAPPGFGQFDHFELHESEQTRQFSNTAHLDSMSDLCHTVINLFDFHSCKLNWCAN